MKKGIVLTGPTTVSFVYSSESEIFYITKVEPFENNQLVISCEVVDLAKDKHFIDSRLIFESDLDELTPASYLDFVTARQNCSAFQMSNARKVVKGFAEACALDLQGLVYTSPFIFSVDALLYLYVTIKRTAEASYREEELLSEVKLSLSGDGKRAILEVGDVSPGAPSNWGASLYAMSVVINEENEAAAPLEDDKLAAKLIADFAKK